jgi:hypothetical protein
MKRLLLAAALILIAVTSFSVWWSTRSPGDPTSVEPETAGVESPEVSPAETGAPLAPGTAEHDSALAPSPTRQETSDDRVSMQERARLELERDARWVEGHVEWPAGCAADEGLEVFAMEANFSADTLHSIVDDVRRGDDIPEFAKKAGFVSAEVAADGAYRLPVDPESETIHMSVLGDTLYIGVGILLGDEPPLLAPSCGAQIHGQLSPPAGAEAPLYEGMAVSLRTKIDGVIGGFNPTEAIRRKVDVRSDGTFELRGVPTSGSLLLTVEAEDFAASSQTLSDLRPGEDRMLRIELSLGGRIAGRIVDETGQPIDDAEVQALTKGAFFGMDSQELRKTESDEDGSFVLEAVAPGKVMLRAEAEGWLENDEQTVQLVDSGQVDNVELLLTSGESIAGQLTWADGSPASGVEVKVRFDQSQMFGMTAFNARRGASGEADTNAEGTFRVTGLGKGPFTVTAQARPEEDAVAESDEDEDDAAPYWKARADGVQPGKKDLALVLEEPITLAGHVVDQDELPVTAFRIVAERPGEGILGNIGLDKEEDDFEDEAGRFELVGLAPGDWEVYAIADGFGAPEAIQVTLSAGGNEEIMFRLVRAASAAGVVVSSAGEPVSGATVEVDLGGPVWQASIESDFMRPKTTSGSEGVFLLEGITPGEVSLRASADGHARSEAVTLQLAVGQQLTDVVIPLRVGATLTGEVFDRDGGLASGRFIQATKMDTYDSEMTFTDGEGQFRLEHLDPGTWQVVAMPAGFTSGGEDADASTQPDTGNDGGGEGEENEMLDMMSQIKTAVTDLTEGGEEHVVIGAPPADPVRVSGTVMHDGKPYSGALITFYAEGENTMQTMRNERVKSDGSYAVELEQPGIYVVQIQMLNATMTQQRIVEFSRTVPEVEETELFFEIPTGRVSGKIAGPGGEPVAGVRVSLHPEGALETGTLWGGQYAESSSDEDGNFDFQGLRAGHYSLMAGGMTFGGMMSDRADYGRQVRSIEVDEGQWLDGESFRLETPGKIAVKVLDSTGGPIAEASIFVRDENGRLLDRLSMITTSGGGSANYGGVEPGDYTVTARRDDLASQESVEIRMEAGTLLLITLLGDEGELLNANVSVKDAEGREVSGMLALTELMAVFGDGFSSKEHRVGPLPPGRYRVTAELGDGRKLKKPVTLTGRPERKMKLRFK